MISAELMYEKVMHRMDMTKETKEALAAKKILFVAGGVGTAPVYPQVKWLHEQGVAADVIVGAKTKELLILEEEMKAVAGNLYVIRLLTGLVYQICLSKLDKHTFCP